MAKYIVLKTLFDVEKFVNKLQEKNIVFAIDLETTSTDPYRGEIVGVGISFNRDSAIYIPIAHKYDQPFPGKYAIQLLKPLIERKHFLAYNALFEVEFLENAAGYSIGNNFTDVALLTAVSGKYEGNSLKKVASIECSDIPVDSYKNFMQNLGFRLTRDTIAEAPVDAVAKYCGDDARATFDIFKKLYPKLKDNPIYQLEAKVLKVTRWLRRNGVLIDVEFLVKERKRLEKISSSLEKLIFKQLSEVAGEPIEFNLRSSRQLGNALFRDLRLPCDSFTATGQFKTGIEFLSRLKWKYPYVQNIIVYKELQKRMSTYFTKYISYVQEDGRIHASYNQIGAVSGRFACSDPNLQNIPRTTEWTLYLGKNNSEKISLNVRKAFVVPEDSWFIEFDYSQVEARIAAGITQEPVLLDVFQRGLDYHTKTASLIFGIPMNQVTKEQRYLGKRLNFALSYGMGVKKLYNILRKEFSITFEQAKFFRRRFLDAYPKMFREAERIADRAERCHFVTTVFGRKIPIFEFKAADAYMIQEARRIAYNQVIQGTAADVAKIGMYKVYQTIKEKYGLDNAKLILMTHDALAFEIKKTVDLEMFIKDISDAMYYKLDKFPPFNVSASIGRSWGELISIEKEMTVKDRRRRYFRVLHRRVVFEISFREGRNTNC